MWSGSVPFLVHWLALSTQPSPQQQHLGYHQQVQSQWQPPPQAGKTQWNLLSDFQQLPEDEIEEFLPQICNILVEREREQGQPVDEYGVYAQFHKLLVEKCAGCLPFGLRVCSLLKSAAQGPPTTGGVFQAVLGGIGPRGSAGLPAVSPGGREDRLRYLHQQAEEATSHGMRLPQHAGYLRAKYYHDLNFMLETMARLGRDLKAHPVDQRNYHLRSAVAQLNSLLFNRMMAQGGGGASGGGGPYPTYGVTAYQVAQACPGAAAFSLHLPLQHCREKVQRILQFVEPECEVLPSKERCPYVLVAEVLEQPFTCKSDALFTHRPLPAIDDVIGGVSADAGLGAVEGAGAGAGASAGVSAQYSTPANAPASYSDAERTGSGLSDHTLYAASSPPSFQPQQPQQPGSGSGWGSLDVRGGQTEPPPSSLPPHLWQQQQQQPQQPYQQYHHHQQQQQQQQQHQQYPPQAPPPQMQGQYPQQYPAHAAPARSPPMFAPIKSVDEKVASIRASSPFGHLPGWAVKSFIVKSGDDLRKELLAMQIIDICQHVFQVEGLDLWLHPYQIISTGHMAGLVEFVEGTMSLDRMKKSAAVPGASSLKDYFNFAFGHSYSPAHQHAVQNFVKSLAGYSLITFLLQVRDRHNANLLVDAEGHIVHIDYGFILGGSLDRLRRLLALATTVALRISYSPPPPPLPPLPSHSPADSPGFNLNFENAPFKFTKEYVEVLGGFNSPAFRQFEDLFVRGYFALQKHQEELAAIVQLFYGARGKAQAEGVRQRLGMRSPQQVSELISGSFDNWRTTQYDRFQKTSNNIYF